MTDKTYCTTREAAELLGVAEATLRYWEREFAQLKPKRTAGGWRKYSQTDIALCRSIKELLYERGLKIEQAKQVVALTHYHSRPRRQYVCRNPEDALRLLREVLVTIHEEHARKRLEAVAKWLEGVFPAPKI